MGVQITENRKAGNVAKTDNTEIDRPDASF